MTRARNLLIGFCIVGPTLASCSASGAVIQWVSDASGLWSDAANWSSYPNLPGPLDDVVIDRPGVEIAVTHDSGDTKLKSLVSSQALVLSAGSLYSVGGYQINNAFTASGGMLVVNPANDQVIASGGINIGPNSTIRFRPRGGSYLFKHGTYTVLKSSTSLSGTFGGWSVGLGKYVDQATNGLSYSAKSLSLTILTDLWAADATMDTKIDVSDLNVWMYNRFQADTDWYRADFSGNGKTDVSDLNICITSFHKAAAGLGLGAGAVPEPGTLTMLVVGAVTMLLAFRFRRFA